MKNELRDFILNMYDLNFTKEVVIYDWPQKPLSIQLLDEVVSSLLEEGLIVGLGHLHRGRYYYRVVQDD